MGFHILFQRAVGQLQRFCPPLAIFKTVGSKPIITRTLKGPGEEHSTSDAQLNKSYISTSSSSSSGTSTDDEEEAALEELFWGPIKTIPDEAFIKLVLRLIDPEGELGGVGAYVSRRCEGSYNHVVMVTLLGASTWVVKVPQSGWGNRWTEADARNLRSEALTIAYIRRHTKVPVPLVLDFNVNMDNELNAPYIIMERLPGTPALNIWYEKGEEGWMPTPKSTPERVAKREAFLTSLAHAMAELRHLKFDKAGTLEFGDNHDKPIVGAVWQSHEPDDKMLMPADPAYKRTVTTRPACSASKYLYFSKIKEFFPPASQEPDPQRFGMRRLMMYILNTPPFSQSKENPDDEKESFVLAHPDLDLQNILVDDDGNVTGIIDWDGVQTVPHCIGYASAPLFIRHDWTADYRWPAPDDDFCQLSPKQLRSYREVYAEAMAAAMHGEGDCVYTEKSAIYNAYHASLYEVLSGRTSTTDFLAKMLHHAVPYVDAREFEIGLSNGWENAEEVLEDVVPEFMDPGTGCGLYA